MNFHPCHSPFRGISLAKAQLFSCPWPWLWLRKLIFLDAMEFAIEKMALQLPHLSTCSLSYQWKINKHQSFDNGISYLLSLNHGNHSLENMGFYMLTWLRWITRVYLTKWLIYKSWPRGDRSAGPVEGNNLKQHLQIRTYKPCILKVHPWSCHLSSSWTLRDIHPPKHAKQISGSWSPCKHKRTNEMCWRCCGNLGPTLSYGKSLQLLYGIHWNPMMGKVNFQHWERHETYNSD